MKICSNACCGFLEIVDEGNTIINVTDKYITYLENLYKENKKDLY